MAKLICALLLTFLGYGQRCCLVSLSPQRFASKSFTPGCFIPFVAGPRNCIGQAFAIMEAKIILAMLISRFSFTIFENYRHAPVVVLIIKPKYGVRVCLEPLDG